MQAYRGIHVQIHVGEHQAYVGVVAREVEGHRRRDRLIYRAPVDVPDVASVAALLRSAAAELLAAADRL